MITKTDLQKAILKDKIGDKQPGQYDALINKLPPITVDDIDQVYVGKPHTCMCGCAGKYYSTNINKKEYWQLHGMKSQSDHNKHVLRVLNKVKKNQEKGIEVNDDHIFTVEVGNTQYTIYLKGDWPI
jgi:hypothetical protein